jgi:hypothetical protein
MAAGGRATPAVTRDIPDPHFSEVLSAASARHEACSQACERAQSVADREPVWKSVLFPRTVSIWPS